jgi:hypothetical protein
VKAFVNELTNGMIDICTEGGSPFATPPGTMASEKIVRTERSARENRALLEEAELQKFADGIAAALEAEGGKWRAAGYLEDAVRASLMSVVLQLAGSILAAQAHETDDPVRFVEHHAKRAPRLITKTALAALEAAAASATAH